MKTARKAALRFGAIASGVLAVASGLIVAAARFDFLGASFHANLAMLLGAIGAIGVGVGLMALTFYSSRSGADDAAGNSAPDDPAP